jgi:hypothetical protein
VTLLRRVLQITAALWFVGSLAFGLFTRWIVEKLMKQPVIGEYTWTRAGAVMGFTLALLMVLISRRLEDVWWWCWAFVLLSLGLSALFALNAAFGLPAYAAAWPWWTLATAHLVIAIALAIGIGQAGQEKPFT